MLLLCASFGVFASLFMIVGLAIDCRQLLLPWIFTMIADALVEASHFVYVILYEKVRFISMNWSVESVKPCQKFHFISGETSSAYGIHFHCRLLCCSFKRKLSAICDTHLGEHVFGIVHLFLHSQVYCLLCVLSQYQEYKVGRGMRKDSFITVSTKTF